MILSKRFGKIGLAVFVAVGLLFVLILNGVTVKI